MNGDLEGSMRSNIGTLFKAYLIVCKNHILCLPHALPSVTTYRTPDSSRTDKICFSEGLLES